MSLSELLLLFVRSSLSNKLDGFKLESTVDWDGLLDLSAEHGLLAIVWDAVKKLSLDRELSRSQLISWELSAREVWDRYSHHEKVLYDIITICNQNNVKVLLLKGVGVSNYYPNPHSRPAGDIDIFLFGDFAKGNEILAKGQEEFDGREATFDYEGVSIENHAIMIYTKTRTEKRIENYLEKSLVDVVRASQGYYKLSPINELIYLLMHAINHFNSSTYPLPIRSIADFGLCLDRNRENISPKRLLRILRDLHIINSFMLFIFLSEKEFGMDFAKYHYKNIPEDDIEKAHLLVLNGDISEKVPWNIPFFQQICMRWKRYNRFKWMNRYLPSTRIERFFATFRLQMMILLKIILKLPPEKRIKQGFSENYFQHSMKKNNL